MPLTRRRYNIGGIVQGVGFRPFVFKIARKLDLVGWVRNTPAGVEIEIQGSGAGLVAFDKALASDLPPLAVISSHVREDIALAADSDFSILASAGGDPAIQIAPDSAVCPDCLEELFDPADRRYRYPFITCTNCGPRYSIITGIPYDRPKTTMAAFPLCCDCLTEYRDPMDRRFHAQPIACPVCGPQMRLIPSPLPNPPPPGEGVKLLPPAGEGWEGGEVTGDSAIRQAAELLKEGKILAIKGIGGYHLAVDACNPQAVARLREHKKRDEKPFAVMAADLATAHRLALLDETEKRLLASPESPIVIVRKQPDSPLSELVAPANGWVGLMLPYAPLHHLIMRDNFQALVMTSGNISDEPVAFQDDDALIRLAEIADYFLTHDRPIHIRSDDSVMRVFQGRPLFYRRARGYAPRAVRLPFRSRPILAVGAELKSAVCLADRDRAFLSQHIGDLQNYVTCDSFRHTIKHLSGILQIRPEIVACDQHPDYLSTRFAEECGLPLVKVQHHHAHLAACMAENGLEGKVLGVILDGTGYGSDGTIWGGEFLVGGYSGYQRAAHFRPIPLPGGDAAVREPWRMALSYLHGAIGIDAFSMDHPIAKRLKNHEKSLFASMLQRGINSPLTSSCGRLFDAVAALLNIRHSVSYDGQAAIELEALAETAEGEEAGLYQGVDYTYRIVSNESKPIQLDFSPIFPEILAEMQAGIRTAVISRRFHATVASAVVEVCLQIGKSTSLDRVVLSGGVFQNRLLSELVYTPLVSQGIEVFTQRLVPPNDGGIALGQAAIAAHIP
ncbi:MAG: carbamoyltransferase HypF [Steroidobacteraceae bacterium]|nr:carbamoyltransferase HypF [Deltaproteobacteria bacterium]